jgi:hypothetical protein
VDEKDGGAGFRSGVLWAPIITGDGNAEAVDLRIEGIDRFGGRGDGAEGEFHRHFGQGGLLFGPEAVEVIRHRQAGFDLAGITSGGGQGGGGCLRRGDSDEGEAGLRDFQTEGTFALSEHHGLCGLGIPAVLRHIRGDGGQGRIARLDLEGRTVTRVVDGVCAVGDDF